MVKNSVSQATALLFGAGMMASAGFIQMNSAYWIFFLTEIVGFDAATAGSLKALVGMFEIAFVFIGAILIEKVWFRWGQYRGWIMISAPLAVVLMMMTFINPVFLGAEMAKMIWMGFFLVAGNFFVGMLMTAMTTVPAVISKTDQDRTLCSQRKAQGNMLIKVFFSMVSLPVILFINSQLYGVSYSEAQSAGSGGFTVVYAFLGLLVIFLYLTFVKKIKGMDPTERICRARYEAKKNGVKLDEEKTEKAPKKVSFPQMIKGFVTNAPAVVILITESARQTATMTITGMAIYFFTFVYGDATMSAVMLTAGNIAGLVATVVSEPFSRKLGSRNTYAIGMVIAIASMVICYFVGVNGQWIFIACICGCYFGMNFMNATMIAVQSNAIVYGEWRDGTIGKSFIMGMFQMAPKVANIVTGLLTGFGLSAIGYVAGMDATPELASGMVVIICLIPAAVLAFGLVLYLLFYKLDTKRMAEISADLEARRAISEAESDDGK